MNHQERPRAFVFFIPTLLVGGAERATINMANAVAGLGYNVGLVVLVGTDGPLKASLSPMVQVTFLGASRTLTSSFGILRVLLQNRDSTIITVMTDASIIVLFWRICLRLKLRGIVVYEHAMISGWPDSVRSHISLRLRRWLYPKANLLLTVSSTMDEEFRRLLKRRRPAMEIIPNAIDSNRIRERSETVLGSIRVRKNVLTPPLVLLAVARLVPIKDLGTFLAVASELKNRGWSVEPIVVGEGPERQRLIQLARELGFSKPELIFIGETLDPWKFMRSADVLVMTSKSEGYPMVLLEAMACGTQIVSTDCGGTSELLANGKYGQLAEIGNVSSIADAVERALDKPIAKTVLIEGTSRFEPIKLAEKLIALTTRTA